MTAINVTENNRLGFENNMTLLLSMICFNLHGFRMVIRKSSASLRARRGSPNSAGRGHLAI
jgi:hypothetical protein